MSRNFVKVNPTLGDYWRSIILFGRNTASYKFALANSLLYFADKNVDTVNIDDVALKFSGFICEHLKVNDKQAISTSNSFLDQCRKFNNQTIEADELVHSTKSQGFRYVFDAFHNIPGGDLPVNFYSKSTDKSSDIIIHDELFKLLKIFDYEDLRNENEARWSLVETAWKLNLKNNLVTLNYDPETELIMEPDKYRRQSVTSARDALNGYQKGYCFYCFNPISTITNNPNVADVDHFFPHLLARYTPSINFDGIWNLVLSCQGCNRGKQGKFEKLPTISLLERLHTRNSFLIESHHPLRETLISQTGKNETKRISFLQKVYNDSVKKLINVWEPINVAEHKF